MGRILLAKFGVHRHSGLKREAVGRCEAGSENDSGDESALDALAVFNGNVTAVNQRLPLGVAVSLSISS